MLTIWRRLLQILTGRRRATAPDESIGRLPGRWRRRSSARSVQQLLDAASRHLSASRFPHPNWEALLLLHTEVVWACRPALLAIKAALDDASQPISAAALRQLKTFLTDPSALPLFGINPIAGRRAAEQLQYTVTGHPECR
jgi:hypothetical protein